MKFRTECEFKPIYHKDGSLWKAECACGGFLKYSVSALPKNKVIALADLKQQWAEHALENLGPRTHY